ncbi:unnamed protein product, partial [Rotaria magnacalcarata]
IYVSTIMDECDIEQLVTTMKEGIRNETVHNDTFNTLWKKTFGYRRLFIRSHTTNEVLEKFPGYSYPCLVNLFEISMHLSHVANTGSFFAVNRGIYPFCGNGSR